MALIKGHNYFPGKTAVEVDISYWLESADGDDTTFVPKRLTERLAAEMLRKIKANPEIGTVFTVVREVRERVANACAHCGSRPRTWEWDCDGQFENVTCDSDQCRTGHYGE